MPLLPTMLFLLAISLLALRWDSGATLQNGSAWPAGSTLTLTSCWHGATARPQVRLHHRQHAALYTAGRLQSTHTQLRRYRCG